MSAASHADRPVSLGLGLVSIGRTWGHSPAPPPTETDALRFLEGAVCLGLRFFDTAPAYGSSERLLGAFLKGLREGRSRLTVASKMGEHWDEATGSAYTDHSYDALRRSIDRSLSRLERIDLLQVHKATKSALESDGVRRALDYARSAGIATFGASVSDLDAADAACRAGAYSVIQLPYNALSPGLEPAFGLAARHGMDVLVNRPFAMGRIVDEGTGDPAAVRTQALRFVLARTFSGHVLTGTKSIDHLRDNIASFEAALRQG